LLVVLPPTVITTVFAHAAAMKAEAYNKVDELQLHRIKGVAHENNGGTHFVERGVGRI
jgi:hypothetical protein